MNLNKAAQALGRKGGSVSGGRKAEASKANAKKAREAKAINDAIKWQQNQQQGGK